MDRVIIGFDVTVLVALEDGVEATLAFRSDARNLHLAYGEAMAKAGETYPTGAMGLSIQIMAETLLVEHDDHDAGDHDHSHEHAEAPSVILPD